MAVEKALRALGGDLEEGVPWPRPKCPACDTGHIRFAEPDAVPDPGVDISHWAFEPEWVRGTFSVRGTCENPACEQAVHGVGDYYVAYAKQSRSDDPDAERTPSWAEFYRVAHLHPPILLMPIPESAPDTVRDGILRSSRVFLVNPSLAATALRATVESFLSSEGISANTPSGGFRTLDDRIKEWGGVDPSRSAVEDLFLAVKWIGNAGTHETPVLSTDEVLDGAGLLDEAFHRLFTGPDLDAKARSVNDAHRKPTTASTAEGSQPAK